jgi:RNA-directed DNA polymerase
VQQALLNILQPIFDVDFHPSSYGYRPKRSCHDAISKATVFIRRHHLDWLVDMDLSKCFDLLDHELIINSVKRKVTDGSILKLINQFLKSQVMIGHNWAASTVESPQGGVISPLSSYSMPTNWFEELGLYSIERVVTGWLAPSAIGKTT